MSSPYAYAMNNPMLFVDPNGMDNVIYLLNAGGSVIDERMKQIRDQANKDFEKMGLNTRVMIADPESFDMNKIDATDAFAVIGRVEEIVTYLEKKGSSFSKDVEGEYAGVNRYKRSEVSAPWGNIITLNVEGLEKYESHTKSSFAEVASLSLIHGAGHNTGMKHAGDKAFPVNVWPAYDMWSLVRKRLNEPGQERIPYNSVMLEGNGVIDVTDRNYLTNDNNNGLGRLQNTIHDIIASPSNQGLIKEYYLSRFGNHPAVPNPSIKIITR